MGNFSWVALMLTRSSLKYLLKRSSTFVPICNNVDVIEGINKSEFENLSLATQESYFKFNNILYKHKAGVAMESPLGTTMTNAFLLFYELKRFE